MLDGAMAGKADRSGRAIRFLPEGIADDAITDVQLDEAMSELAEAEILRTRRPHQAGVMEVPPGLVTRHIKALAASNPRVAGKFKAFFEAVRGYFGLALKRAAVLEKGFRDGTLDRGKYDEHLDKVLGLGEDGAKAEVDVSRLDDGWEEAALSNGRTENDRLSRRIEAYAQLEQKLKELGLPPLLSKEEALARKRDLQFGEARTKNHVKNFIERHPELEGRVIVHHAVEQRYLEENGGEISWQKLHSVEVLRGVPRELNRELHARVIQLEWNDFRERNRSPAEDELLDFAAEIDARFGRYFIPPIE